MKLLKITTPLLIVLWANFFIHGAPKGKKEIYAKSKIEKVMVYQDRALVTRRTVPLKLASGTYEINLRDLPQYINNDSVRTKVYRGRDAHIKILDVEIKTYQLEKAPEEKKRLIQAKLQKYLDKKKRINNRLAVLNIENEYLSDIEKKFLETAGYQGGPKVKVFQRLKVNDYNAMLNYLVKKYSANMNARLKEEINKRAVDKKIAFIKGKMYKLNIRQSSIPRKKLVKTTIEVSKPGKYILDISYINYRVKWEPSYDIRVMVENKQTEFIGYGIVSQNSGEDWINSKVSYSTAQPALQGLLPELLPLYATLAAKVERQSGRKKYQQKFSSQQAFNRAMLDNINIAADKSPYSGEGLFTSTASVRSKQQVGSLVFDVLKRSDIRSDNSPHRTAISNQSFPVKFEYISIPKINPHAYLQAIGKNSMKTPILKGKLNIFMGNDFVGSSNTGNILPGEDFELTLSVNENIRVTRKLDEKEVKESGFLSSTQKTRYTFFIKVENYTGNDIIMNILDQVPVSNQEDVEVEVHKFSHKPVMRNKKGIIKWQLKMRSKETVKLTFSFTLSVPEGKEAAFFKTLLPPSLYLQKLPQVNTEEDLFDYNVKEKSRGPAMRTKMY
ncbi:MAG: mucoidy inhibitor MuiA family protein [bacterium]|nr:mucoidy inhibitor MuiA family protein [bacterium]